MFSLSSLIPIAAANPGAANSKMAAAIVKKGKLLGLGMNSLKTHPLQAQFGRNEHCIHLHAEIDAIRNALRRVSVDELEGSTLYVARVLRNGRQAMAKPCKGCQRAIIHFHISNCIYTTGD